MKKSVGIDKGATLRYIYTVSRSSPHSKTSVNLPWLKKLANFKSLKDLKADLFKLYPALTHAPMGGVAVVGAAELGLDFLKRCSDAGIQIVGVYDDDRTKHGKQFHGHEVLPVESLKNCDRATPVVIASHRLLVIYKRIKAAGFENVWPLPLMAINNKAAFPPHPFYAGLLEDLVKNRATYAKLGGLFADEKSRKVLDGVLGFRMTLNPEYLEDIIDGNLYFPKDIIRLEPQEIFVDGGAFIGDTIEDFIVRKNGEFSRIFAFEPDPATHLKLSERYKEDKRISVFNAGLFSRKGTVRFNNDGSRNSFIGDSGGAQIPTMTVDDVTKTERISYMKLNIEGAECDALMGAKNTIRKWHPKLAISVYHQPSHLWQIPLLVRKLWSGYKLYLRQHDGGIIETVLYAVKG